MNITKRKPTKPARGPSGVNNRDAAAALDVHSTIGDNNASAPECTPSSFWTRRSVNDVGVSEPPHIGDIAEMKASFWPEDENVDEFLAFVRQQRNADRDAHK